MTMRGLEGEDLKRALRELITSWEPIIRDAESFEQAEDRLLHLEENDESFHKHDLVRALKRKLDEILSPLIDDEPERNSTTGQTDSHENLKFKLGKNLGEAVESLLANFNDEFDIGKITGYAEGVDPLKTSMMTDDEEVSSFNSLYDQTRKDAMQKLNHLISGEIVHNKHWVQLRKNLIENLADPDDQISLCRRKDGLSASGPIICSGLDFGTTPLFEFLSDQFKSTNQAVINKGLDFSNKDVIKILKAFRLVVEFQQEAPNYWVRYPLIYMEEVVQSTLNLITSQLSPSQQNRLTPLHFVAVLDPKAHWFTKWMVETSVKHCLEFSSSHRMSQDDLSHISDEFSKISLVENEKRQHYTRPELDYILFIHSLHFLGCLLFYEKGRALFPIKLRDRQAPISVYQLLKALMPLVIETGELTLSKRASVYRMSSMVTEVLKSLCSTEAICSICFCKDEIMNELLSPVEQYLDESPDQSLPSEITLLHIADILCVIASGTNGRRQLLYDEGKEFLSENKSSSAAHLIAKFTRKALLNKFSDSLNTPSNAVTGAYLYVCRQLYNTCEGLYVLSQYELHKCIADSWKSVSKCEKFGYGVMVTQVAATAAGIQALQSTGYIKALLVELWSSLECGPQDVPVFAPKSWPIDPVDRNSQKHFIRLVNILSAFPAVYELLKGEPLPSKDVYSLREIPDSIMALIDRLIIIDSTAKTHSLFNYEQSHTFGLRLLSVMVSCLDTFLILESQYKFQEFLLQEQELNKTQDSDTIILDLLSIERNYILVKTFLIGGPSERTLPPKSIDEDKSGTVKPPLLFSSYPIPREYQPNIAGRTAGKQENELTKFLSSSKVDKKPKVWLEKCRDLLFKTLAGKSEHSKGHSLLQILEQTVENQCNIQDEAVFHLFDFTGTENTIKNYKLSPLQTLGIKVAV
ncbi:hypothetical protein Btru_065340, partial [Bulinus truncatus]